MLDSENKENEEPVLNNIESNKVQNNTLIDEYERKIHDLEEEIERLQYGIESTRKEYVRRDQCIQVILQETEDIKKTTIQYINQIKELDQIVFKQSEEFLAVMHKCEVQVNEFSKHQKLYFEMYKQYEDAIVRIRTCKENENNCVKKLKDIQNQKAVFEATYASLKDQCCKEIKKIHEQVGQGSDQYQREIAQLQSMEKRLQIKVTSLETALIQKSEECLALSALYDDIIGKQS